MSGGVLEDCPVASDLVDLDIIERRLAAGGVGDLVAAYVAVLRQPGLGTEERAALEDFSRFIRRRAHVLARHPESLLQEAVHEPAGSAPARAALLRHAARTADRPLLRWANRPERQSDSLITLVGLGGFDECRFAGDGTRILSYSSREGAVQLWDAETGRGLARVEVDRWGAASLSPDGARLAVAAKDGALRLLDCASGRETEAVPAPAGALALLEFGLGGSRLVGIGRDGLVIRNARDLALIHRIEEAAADYPRFVLDEAGRTLVAQGLSNGRALLTDIETGSSRAIDCDISWCAISPDRRAVVGCIRDQDSLAVFDARTGERIVTLAGHDWTVTGCAFSPDGGCVASCSRDRTVRLWDTTTWLEIACIPSGADAGRCWFSRDGSRLVALSNDEAVLIDPLEGLKLATLRHAEMLQGVAFSPDGARVATWSYDRTIRIWSAATGAPLVVHRGHSRAVNAADFSPDGLRVASASSDGTIRIWDATALDPPNERAERIGSSEDITSCAFSPDGGRFATGSTMNVSGAASETVTFWDGRSGSRLAGTTGYGISACAFSPSGRVLAAAGGDIGFGQFRLIDSETARVIANVPGQIREVRHLAVAPDGERIAISSGTTGDPTHLLDARTGRILAVITVGEAVADLAFSPDGRRLAVLRQQGATSLFGAERGERIEEIPGSKDGSELAFSPDGRVLAIRTSDGIRLRNVRTDVERMLAGQHAFTFSPDGARIATTSADGALAIWDATTGAPVASPTAIRSVARVLAFSPDGRFIAAASSERTLLTVRDSGSGAVVASFYLGAELRSLAWRPDGRAIALGLDHGDVRLMLLEDVGEAPLVALQWRSPTDGSGAIGCPSCRVWFAITTSEEARGCAYCGAPLRVATATITGEWRRIEAAWTAPAPEPPAEPPAESRAPLSLTCVLCGRTSCGVPYIPIGVDRQLGAGCMEQNVNRPAAAWKAMEQDAVCWMCEKPASPALVTRRGAWCLQCIDACFRALAGADLFAESSPEKLIAFGGPDATTWQRGRLLFGFSARLAHVDRTAKDRSDDVLARAVANLGLDRDHPLDAAIRQAAVNACVAAGRRILRPLLDGVSSRTSISLANTVLVAGQVAPEEPEVRALLERAARNPDPQVRTRVGVGLLRHEAPWVDAILARLAADADADVRLATADIFKLRGLQWHESGDRARACSAFEQAVRLFETGTDKIAFALRLTLLARWLQDHDDHESALPLCRRVVEIHSASGKTSDLAVALNNLGLSLSCLGEIDAAERALNDSLSFAPASPNPHYWLARVHRSRGDAAAEAAAWRRYLELGPPMEARREEAIARLAELGLC